MRLGELCALRWTDVDLIKAQIRVSRSATSHLVMLGVPLQAVQELLGHSSLEMAMRYAHLAPGLKQEVVKVLADRERLDLNRANAMHGLPLLSEE